MLRAYVRDAERFEDHAAEGLLARITQMWAYGWVSRPYGELGVLLAALALAMLAIAAALDGPRSWDPRGSNTGPGAKLRRTARAPRPAARGVESNRRAGAPV